MAKEYIEREALIANIAKEIETQRERRNVFATVAFAHIRGVVANAPTADVVEVRHGEWLFHDTDENDMTIVKCSECGRKRYFGANYCPNCGAKMDGKGEGE